jgi:hypothetical protein
MDVVDGEHEAFFTLGGYIMRPSLRPDHAIWVGLIDTGEMTWTGGRVGCASCSSGMGM